MFWDVIHENSLSDILNKEEVNLTEVLDHETLLQECRTQNEDLIKFFKSKDVINQLVMYVIQCPSEDLAESSRFKYPSLSCEVLTSELSEIHDLLINGWEMNDQKPTCFVDLVFNNFLVKEDINPLIMSFSLRVILALLKCNDKVMYQISDFKDSMLILTKYIHLNGVSTFFEDFISSTKEGDEIRIKWLRENRFVYNLTQMMCDNNEMNLAIENVLTNIIKYINDDSINKNVKANLIEMFEEDNYLDILFKRNIANSKSSSHLVSSSLIIICTITEVSREDGSNPFISNMNYIKDNLDIIQDLLKNPPKDTNKAIRCTIGEIKTVGRVRIEILRLLKNVIKLNDTGLLNKIHDSNILYLVINQMAEFKWNSMYHLNVLGIFNEVFKDITINSSTKFLQSSLVLHFELFKWYQSQTNEILQSKKLIGYSGIIWQIGCLLDKFIESELGKDIIEGDENIMAIWSQVKEKYLIPRNKKNEISEDTLDNTFTLDFKLSELNADDDDDESDMVTNPDLIAEQLNCSRGDNNVNDIFADLASFHVSSPKSNSSFDFNTSDPLHVVNHDSSGSEDWFQMSSVPVDDDREHVASDDASSSSSDSEEEKPKKVIQQNKQGSAKFIMSGSSRESLDFGLFDAPVDSPSIDTENSLNQTWPDTISTNNTNSAELSETNNDNWASF